MIRIPPKQLHTGCYLIFINQGPQIQHEIVVMSIEFGTTLKCKERNKCLRQKHNMASISSVVQFHSEKFSVHRKTQMYFTCIIRISSLNLADSEAYFTIHRPSQIIRLMFCTPQMSNLKDMPESNILLEKGGNIALCQTLKKYLLNVFFVTKTHFDYDCNLINRFHCFFNSWMLCFLLNI